MTLSIYFFGYVMRQENHGLCTRKMTGAERYTPRSMKSLSIVNKFYNAANGDQQSCARMQTEIDGKTYASQWLPEPPDHIGKEWDAQDMQDNITVIDNVRPYPQLNGPDDI